MAAGRSYYPSHHDTPGVNRLFYEPPLPPYPYDLPHVPPPYPSHAPQPLYFTPEQQSIRTLFVSGLPEDVKPREIHNLFRRRLGFESCQLEYTGRGDQVVAFATFYDHRSAVAVMSELNETVFDPQSGATIHIELARSNSRTKRPRGGAVYTIIDKRVKRGSVDREQSSTDGDGGSEEPLDSDNVKSSNKASLLAIKSDEASGSANDIQATGEEKDRTSTRDIPACSTLFIANLGPNCTEEELKTILSQCSGFQTLKMRGRNGMPVAFADFKDIECSTEAMNSLLGKRLDSSDRGGLHLEYSSKDVEFSDYYQKITCYFITRSNTPEDTYCISIYARSKMRRG